MERIRCPAPLPEGPPGPTVAKMIGRVLSKIPSGKDGGKDSEAELHTLRIRTEGIASYPREDSRGGESGANSPRGKKRATSKDLETEMPKQGKKVSLGSLSQRAFSPRHVRQRASPRPSCKLITILRVLRFSKINNQDSSFAVRIAALLNRVRLRGIFLRR